MIASMSMLKFLFEIVLEKSCLGVGATELTGYNYLLFLVPTLSLVRFLV